MPYTVPAYSYWVSFHNRYKAVVDGPVGQILAGPLFLKVKTNFHFTESK